jgi:predicted enzyme related to lactoylglutathione lyase
MPEFSLAILYVDDVAASVAFYGALLCDQPIEASPTFAMFALPGGSRLGLWSRATVEPSAEAPSGGGELAFTADDVDAVYADWRGRGRDIAQPPTDMDFGRTFVARDPDGHRLRVFAPAAP